MSGARLTPASRAPWGCAASTPPLAPRARRLGLALALAAALLAVGAAGLPGVARGQTALVRSSTLFGARRGLDGELIAPVQQYLFAEAGGPRDDLALRLDLRLAADAASPADNLLQLYELQLRHGRPGGNHELVAGRQVLFSGTGAFLADAARLTLHASNHLELSAAAGLERSAEVETPVFGPHLALLSARFFGLARTTLQLSYLLRGDRDGRREDRIGLTGQHWLPLPLRPQLEFAGEFDAAAGRLNLVEGGLTVHPGATTALALWASRTEPQSWGPAMTDGLWELFLAGPTLWAKAQAAWTDRQAGAVAASCARYRLEPTTGPATTGGTLCRAAYQAPRTWPIRPALSGFLLGGAEAGDAVGGGLALTVDPGLGLQATLRGDLADYTHASGAAGTVAWSRLSLGRSLFAHWRLEAVGEYGRGMVALEEELRGLAVLSYQFRGVRP